MEIGEGVQLFLTAVLVWATLRYAGLTLTLVENDREKERVRRNRMAVSLHQQAKRVHDGAMSARGHTTRETNWQAWKEDASELLRLSQDAGDPHLLGQAFRIYQLLHRWEEESQAAHDARRETGTRAESLKRRAVQTQAEATELAGEMVEESWGYVESSALPPEPKPWWARRLLR